MRCSKWTAAAWACLAWGVARGAQAVDVDAPGGDSGRPAWMAALEGERDALEAQAKLWESQPGAGLAVEVPSKPMGPGAKGPQALLLCKALELRGFGECDPSEGYGPKTASRVAAAQGFYGLVADGLAGPQLYLALALPPAAKAALARASAEDLGRLMRDPEALAARRAVVVNAAAFRLRAYGPDGARVDSRAVVGRPDRRTPLGTIHVVSLKLNPGWTPPETVMRKDVYPSLDGDREWIRRHGLVMLDKDGAPVEMEGVGSEEAKAMGYRFSQPAGPGAALGRLKFETDSRQDIYLHDTNERGLFAQADRAKSSGCVRVQLWEELAAWAWGRTPEQVERELSEGGQRWVKVQKVPVFIGYRRAQVEDGKVVVYPDVYGAGGAASK